jgi:hypothetical protein
MVHDKLTATERVAFLHGFATPVQLEESHVVTMKPSHFRIEMTLGSQTFEHGRGFTEGRGAQGNLVAVFALHDPEELGIGEHPYSLSVASGDATLYEESGVLEVVANPNPGENPGVLLWFDALHPSDPEADKEELPAAEIPTTVQDTRLRICGECPAFKHESGECAECGCWMPYKSGLATAECPLGKWEKWGLDVVPS